MTAIILYKADNYHSKKEVLGIFINKLIFKKTVKNIISDELKNDSGNMDYEEEKENIKYHIDFFFQYNQTQGLPEFELIAEQVEINSLTLNK